MIDLNKWSLAGTGDRWLEQSQALAEQLEDEEFKQQLTYDTDEDKLIDADRFWGTDGEYEEE